MSAPRPKRGFGFWRSTVIPIAPRRFGRRAVSISTPRHRTGVKTSSYAISGMRRLDSGALAPDPAAAVREPLRGGWVTSLLMTSWRGQAFNHDVVFGGKSRVLNTSFEFGDGQVNAFPPPPNGDILNYAMFHFSSNECYTTNFAFRPFPGPVSGLRNVELLQSIHLRACHRQELPSEQARSLCLLSSSLLLSA